MSKRHDNDEEWAIFQLGCIIALSKTKGDALPGSVVKLVKQAHNILLKRRIDAAKKFHARKNGNDPLVAWD